MNQHPPHIKRSGCRLAAMTLFLLLAALQSPAQQHGKKHARHNVRQHVRHSGGMPDSVNTADEEIRPFAPQDETVKVDTTTVQQYADTASPEEAAATTAAAPDNEEKESPPVLRSIPDSVIRHRKKDRDFAYANDPSWWKDEPVRRNDDSERAFFRLLDSKWFRWFIYMFLGGVLLYALYRIIAENNLRFFYRTPSRIGETRLGDAAALPEEDLDQLLKKAMDEKAHRMAIRYLYLKTLRMLEARQMIRWHIQATDEEYARQLDTLPQGESFRWLMAAYERVWYGKFDLNDQQFSRLFQYFQDFHTSIDHSRRA